MFTCSCPGPSSSVQHVVCGSSVMAKVGKGYTSHIARYTPSIPPMHQEVTHLTLTTGNMQNIECSLWTRDAFTKENIVTSEYCEYINIHRCKNLRTLTAAVVCPRVPGWRAQDNVPALVSSLLATVNKLHFDDQQLCPLSPAQPGAVHHVTRFAT